MNEVLDILEGVQICNWMALELLKHLNLREGLLLLQIFSSKHLNCDSDVCATVLPSHNCFFSNFQSNRIYDCILIELSPISLLFENFLHALGLINLTCKIEGQFSDFYAQFDWIVVLHSLSIETISIRSSEYLEFATYCVDFSSVMHLTTF